MSERKAIETRIVQNDKGHFRLEALNGYVLLSDESATVCANVQDQLDRGITDDTECGEVAASILATFCSRRGNPPLEPGDCVKHADTNETSIPAYRDMQGEIVSISGKWAIVAWDCDRTDQRSRLPLTDLVRVQK